tara:strand:+ start:45 stop:560 length:516 start_codon:yes stop_codon:yes gene_type:complete
MAIAASDIVIRLSGGASVTDPNLSIGGVMSTVGGGVITTDVQNNDMDDITSVEAGAGITIRHGYFYENAHGSLTYIAPAFYIDTITSSTDTNITLAVADEAKNTAIEVLANEETEPATVTFTAPANFAAGILTGDLDFGDYRGFWVKYICGSSAAAVLDTYTLGIQGDTNP